MERKLEKRMAARLGVFLQVWPEGHGQRVFSLSVESPPRLAERTSMGLYKAQA